jgi:2-dehydro-3-deoxy-L-rhamnonate dehydrogenase (NAD+)
MLMNDIDLAGRVAIVTGAARGIGRAIAERFAAAGARVALWDIDAAAAKSAAAEIAGAIDLACDVTDPATIATALAATEARLGPPDILINNAGISGPNHSLDAYPAAEWRRVIEIDLVGVFNCCRAVVPAMRQRDYGRIVNIASIAGKEGNPNA